MLTLYSTELKIKTNKPREYKGRGKQEKLNEMAGEQKNIRVEQGLQSVLIIKCCIILRAGCKYAHTHAQGHTQIPTILMLHSRLHPSACLDWRLL